MRAVKSAEEAALDGDCQLARIDLRNRKTREFHKSGTKWKCNGQHALPTAVHRAHASRAAPQGRAAGDPCDTHEPVNVCRWLCWLNKLYSLLSESWRVDQPLPPPLLLSTSLSRSV